MNVQQWHRSVIDQQQDDRSFIGLTQYLRVLLLYSCSGVGNEISLKYVNKDGSLPFSNEFRNRKLQMIMFLSSAPTVVCQRCQIPALLVDSVAPADMTSELDRCELHDRSSYTADVTCHDTARVIVIQDHDICRVKRLSVNYQVHKVFCSVKRDAQ